MTFIEPNGARREVDAPVGLSVLEIAHRNNIDLEGACEGSLACSTCHVIVDQEDFERLKEPTEDEEDMLDLAFGLTHTSRLGCQIIITEELDGLVLAAAGLRRTGLFNEAEMTMLDPDQMVPAPGQGALAVQCRADDETALELLSRIDDPRARAEGTAERTFLRELDAGCTAPVGAHAEAIMQGALYVRLKGLVASPDGRDVVRVEGDGEPEEVGTRLAHEALRAGAFEILEAIRG
jgi:2Fe-2S ferredoxin